MQHKLVLVRTRHAERTKTSKFSKSNDDTSYHINRLTQIQRDIQFSDSVY